MIIGVPKEIKNNEFRVGITPSGAEQLKKAGHMVIVERSAGVGTNIADDEYLSVGAEIADTAEEVYANADMIVKVKEPQPQEYPLIRAGQILFTFFHFAASEELTKGMIESGAVCVAYETMQLSDGTLPILTPMSEVAGRMAIQQGAKYLEKPTEGRGVLLGGVPGVLPAEVTILGGGIVGQNAAIIAAGMGANVTILDVNTERMRYLDDVMPKNIATLYSNPYNIRDQLSKSDLVVGAVHVRGSKAPILVTRDMLGLMKKGAVIVDVAVDQGGCVETIRPTTHADPIYVVDGIIHYGVANMPGAVPSTSTFALTNETLTYALKLANKGYPQAILDDSALKKGLNIAEGKLVLEQVADLFNLPYASIEEALE